jgi:histone H3/H4
MCLLYTLQKGVDALHDDAEMYLTKFFARSQKRAIHAGRLTIHVDDMKDEDM